MQLYRKNQPIRASNHAIQQMINQNKRIDYLDVAKGGLIIFLLFSHYYWGSARTEGDFPLIKSFLSTRILIISFFMQCFFFISGYCTSINRACNSFLLRQCRQLLIPIFVFWLISCVCNTVYPIPPDIKLAIPFADWAYWFLWAMLTAKIILYIILKASGKPYIYLSVCFILFLVGICLHTFKIGVNYCFYWHGLGSCLFMAIGYFCRTHHNLYEKARRASAILYPWLMVLLVLLGVEIPVFDAAMDISPIQIPLFLLVSVSGSLAFLFYSELIHGMFKRILIFFGTNSIVVYGIQAYFLRFFMFWLCRHLQPHGPLSNAFFFFATYTCVIGICAVWIFFFKLKHVRWLMGRQ